MDVLKKCFGRWREVEKEAGARADLQTNDPYGVLGLLAHPAPERIDRAYHELSERHSADAGAVRKICAAYQELRIRGGAIS